MLLPLLSVEQCLKSILPVPSTQSDALGLATATALLCRKVSAKSRGFVFLALPAVDF
jgi:hypothetical protein